MSRRYIITLTAANRAGILAAVTEALAELGANLVAVSQAAVQKFSTMILAADFPDELQPQVIVDHIHDIGRPFGIDVCLKDPRDEVLPEDRSGLTRCFLTATGSDRPGLLRDISARLAFRQIDITDLYACHDETDRSFVLVLELAVPQDADLQVVRSELDELGRTAGFSASVQHERDFTPPTVLRPLWTLLN